MRDALGQREVPVAQLALAAPGHGQVGGDDDGFEAVLGRAREHALGLLAVALDVELKPQRPGRGGRDLGEVRRRAGGQAVDGLRSAGRARGGRLAVGMQQPLLGHRREQHRGPQAPAEQRAGRVDRGDVDHDARAQPDLAPSRPVLADRLLGARSAREVVVVRLREQLARPGFEFVEQLHGPRW